MFCLVPTEKKSVLQNRSHLPEVAVRTPAEPGSRGAGVNRSFTWDASLLRGGVGGTGKARRFPSAHRRSPASTSGAGLRQHRATHPARGRGRVVRWIATASPGGEAARQWRPRHPSACAVKRRRRPALGHSPGDSPASSRGWAPPHPRLPLRAPGPSGRARERVPPASQTAGCMGSRSTKEAAWDESRRVGTCAEARPETDA